MQQGRLEGIEEPSRGIGKKTRAVNELFVTFFSYFLPKKDKSGLSMRWLILLKAGQKRWILSLYSSIDFH